MDKEGERRYRDRLMLIPPIYFHPSCWPLLWIGGATVLCAPEWAFVLSDLVCYLVLRLVITVNVLRYATRF